MALICFVRCGLISYNFSYECFVLSPAAFTRTASSKEQIIKMKRPGHKRRSYARGIGAAWLFQKKTSRSNVFTTVSPCCCRATDTVCAVAVCSSSDEMRHDRLVTASSRRNVFSGKGALCLFVYARVRARTSLRAPRFILKRTADEASQ